MQAERWQRVQEVFDQALELNGDERSAFLDQTCGDDPELRREVEAMLEVDDSLSVDYLETVVMGGSALLTETFDPILKRGTIGKYKIVEKVGEGGFGMVHRGVDQDLKRDVAIKTCTSSDERLRLRFQREAEISARLQHPNITTVHDLGLEGGIPYLVQEFLTGEDLSDKIERNEPLDTSTRIDYLLQIARGLAHAHKHGVLHRDVKPGNMRVLHNGRLKILDFGIARLVDERNPITTEGVAVGTIGYLSPEQFEGTGVDRRSDIFSFGVVAYELLTQTRPFPGATFSEISYKLMYETPQSMGELWPDCPVALEHLVTRCLEKEKEKRYQSFRELLPVLEDIHRQLTQEDDGSSLLVTAGQEAERRQRNRWLIMAAGVLGLLVLLIVSIWVGPRTDPPATSVSSEVASAVPPPQEVPGTSSAQTPSPEVPGTSVRGNNESLEESLEVPGTSARDTNDSLEVPGTSARDTNDSLEVPGTSEPLEVPGTSSKGESGSLEESQEVPGTSAKDKNESLEGSLQEPLEVPGTSARAENDSLEESLEVPGTSTESLEVPGTSSKDENASLEVPGTSTRDTNDSLEVPGTSTEGTSTEDNKSLEVPGTSSKDVNASLEVPGTSSEPSVETPRDPVEVKPILRRRVEPVYPRRAYTLKIEARVTIGVRVDENGKVIQTLVLSSSVPDMGFEEAAERAARKSRYYRGTRDGVPAAIWTEVTYDFKYR